ncbi:MAG: hypothetical protein M3258_08265 [Thermoproteota archaeon]|nr:hypothetical protein [Thermoproteota archaeon]
MDNADKPRSSHRDEQFKWLDASLLLARKNGFQTFATMRNTDKGGRKSTQLRLGRG